MSTRDRDEISRDLQRERETRIRPIDVRRPDGRGAAYSGGVEIEIHASANTSTTIDTNPAELRAWAEKMLRYSKRLEGIETCPACANPNWPNLEHEMECERA